MNLSRTTSRIGAIVATIGAIVVLAASAQAATSKPAGMSQPEYRALTIRSEALNTLYGNAVTRLSPQQFKGLYQAGANRMAPQVFAALVAALVLAILGTLYLGILPGSVLNALDQVSSQVTAARK